MKKTLRTVLAMVAATALISFAGCNGKGSTTPDLPEVSGPQGSVSTPTTPINQPVVTPPAVPATDLPDVQWGAAELGKYACPTPITLSSKAVKFNAHINNTTKEMFGPVGGVWWDPNPGCERTTTQGAQGLSYDVSKKPDDNAQFQAGEEGDVTFTFDPKKALESVGQGDATCVYGRFQVDANVLNRDKSKRTSGIGVVISTGKTREECTPPPPTCSGFPAPTITGDISSTPGPTSYVFGVGTVAPAGGSFIPSLPQTVNRPDYGQPTGSFSTTYTLGYGPEGLHCSVSKSFTKPVPPKDPTCKDFPAPTITGDIASEVQATQVVFSVGTVAPGGGSFIPTLPQTVARPNYGQPPGSFSTTYTLPYGPEGLQCHVARTFTKPVPPKDGTCSDFPPPVITGSPATSQTATQVTVTAGTVAPPSGTFNPVLPMVVNRPPYGQPAGQWNTTYTVPYGPEALHCSVHKDFNGPVPPRDPPQECHMSIIKSVNTASASVGDELTFRIEFANTGTANCTGGGVEVRDTVSALLDYKRERHSSNENFFNHSGSNLTWNYDVLTPGESGWVEWDGKVLDHDCGNWTVTNTATIWSTQTGSISSNTTSTSVHKDCPPPCQAIHLDQADGCYKPNPWGNGENPADVCGYFNLAPTIKDLNGSGDSYVFLQSAKMVVVHWGGASCSQGAQSYSFTENALAGGTVINPAGNPGQGGFSFAQYCGCPNSIAKR